MYGLNEPLLYALRTLGEQLSLFFVSCSSGSMHDPSSDALEGMVSGFVDADAIQQPHVKTVEANQCPMCGSFRCEKGACKREAYMMCDEEHEDYRIAEIIGTLEVRPRGFPQFDSSCST